MTAPEPMSMAQLRAAIGASSIVALGENHEDGSALRLKTELVRYLHEEAGFDRVVVEAGLFSCREMDEALDRGERPESATALCNFNWAVCSAEAFSLVEYLAETRSTSRPLRVSGIDPQLSGSAPRERLLPSIEQALQEPLQPRSREAIAHLFDLRLKRTEEERNTDRDLLESLHERVARVLGADTFWVRVVDGLRFLDRDHWDFQARGYVTYELGNARDLLMAQNLLWLKKQFPNERMILLAANSHVMRESWAHPRCDDPSHDHGDGPLVPMGRTVSAAIPDDYFAIAISAAAGRTGLPGSEVEELPRATNEMVEFFALDLPGLWGFRDRAQLREHGLSPSSHIAPPTLLSSWDTRFDGLIAFKAMAPHTPREGLGCSL